MCLPGAAEVWEVASGARQGNWFCLFNSECKSWYKFRDAEEADVEKERLEQAKGPAAQAHELTELSKIYEARGLSADLARQVRPCGCCFHMTPTCILLTCK